MDALQGFGVRTFGTRRCMRTECEISITHLLGKGSTRTLRSSDVTIFTVEKT
jgi:hypothetical protein